MSGGDKSTKRVIYRQCARFPSKRCFLFGKFFVVGFSLAPRRLLPVFANVDERLQLSSG